MALGLFRFSGLELFGCCGCTLVGLALGVGATLLVIYMKKQEGRKGE